MASGDTSYPFDNGNANEPEFRKLFQAIGDGIQDDYTGTAFSSTVNSGTQTVTIGPGRCRSASAVLDATLAQSFTLTGEGTQPAAGQTRIDRVVVRTDYAGDKVERVLITGTPGATPLVPNLAADPNGLWDCPLWRYVRTVTGSGTTITQVDERRHIGPVVFARDVNALADAHPVGTTVVLPDGRTFQRVKPATSSPVWVASNGATTAPLDPATGFFFSGGSGFISTPYVALDMAGRISWHGEMSGGSSGVNNEGRVIARTTAQFAPAAGQAESFFLPIAGTDVYPARGITAFVRRNGGFAELVCNTSVAGGLTRISLSGIGYRAA